jgi:hypothetical protein
MIIFIVVLTLSSSCTQTKKMQLYKKFKNEIVKDVFKEFEEYLPESYENSIMAQIRYAPSYIAFGLSGIDVMFNLEDAVFMMNKQKLRGANIIPSEIFIDTLSLNHSNPEYYSIIYNKAKIAIPKVSNDFCQVNDTCFIWNDLETVILEAGTKKVFSKKNDSEYIPEKPNCNYSIGAFISEEKKQIIYWLFIYD